MTERPIELELVEQGMLCDDLEILETRITPTLGDEDLHIVIRFRIAEDLADSCALGVMFTLGALSFHDARPRGVSDQWFEGDDQLRAADLLRQLRFARGRLEVYFDYLRGRCLKTRVNVSSDGTVELETINRGQAATRWVDRLMGKSFLRVAAGSSDR